MKLLKVPLIFLIFSLFVSCGPEPKVVPARIQFQTDFKTAKARLLRGVSPEEQIAALRSYYAQDGI